MLEYRILIQKGDSKPYSLTTFSSFESAYFELIRLIELQKTTVHKEYYVLNDFYKNEYTPFLHDITKYTIEVRDVNKWEMYKAEKVQKPSINKKIIPFK